MWRGGIRQRVKSLLMTQHHSLHFPTPFHHHPPPSTASLRPTTMSTASQDDIFKHKKIIRTKVKKSLRLMNPSLRSHEDDVIQRLVLDASWFKSSRRFCAYISCSALREVDTSKLLSDILHSTRKEGSEIAEKKLYVPHVEDMNCHMRMLKMSSIDDLIANYMDILEPAAVDSDGNVREDVMQANEPCDLFLLPDGGKMKTQNSYYDNFLRSYQELAREKNWQVPLFVALSYSLQIMDEGVIPVTENDVPVDALVSSSGVIRISQSALERIH